jgi:hypothetical protein
VSAVLLIGIRTWRLVFRQDLSAETPLSPKQ